ncbi:hypothetical protein ACEZCY_00325 [Streptacidiphilus sp. N1-12]|uniref:Secreted protein n=2 Tax=Streptacidiphilus alkalitolerans TaxID=3342712 RepID=A0ABV6WXE7_9ACTN
MRRMFWMAVGAGATVWTYHKAQQVARSITPGSLADSAARGAVDLGGAVRSFAGEVRAGMLQRELELNRELGLDGSVLATGSDAPVLRGQVRRRVEIQPAAPATTSTDITPYNRNEDL